MQKSIFYLILLTIVFLAILIRVLPLHSEAVSGDELFSRDVSISFYDSGIKKIAKDLVHPPFYYFMLHPVIKIFGDDQHSLRIMSLLSGVMLLLMISLWTSKLTGSRSAGLLAGILIALSSVNIEYSTYARSYSLYSLLIFISVFFFYYAINKEKIIYWVCYSLTMTISLLTHYIALFYLIVLGLYLLLTRKTDLLLKHIKYSVPSVLALGIWLIYVIPFFREKEGLSSNLEWIGNPDLFSLFHTFAKFNGLPAIAKGTTITLFVVLIIIILVFYSFFKERTWSSNPILMNKLLLFFALGFFVPLMLFLCTQPPLSMTIWGIRHIFPSQAFFTIFLVSSVWFIFRKNKNILILVAMALIILQASGTVKSIQSTQRTPYNLIALHLQEIDNKSTPVLTTWYYGIGRTVNYYMSNKDKVENVNEIEINLFDEFILLYRPKVSNERVVYEKILEGGWNKKYDIHFGGEYGTTLVKLIRY